MTQQSPAEANVMQWDEPPSRPSDASRDWPQTRAGFDALIERYQAPLVRYAFRRLGQLQDAEDAVQEVFVRAYLQAGDGQHVSNTLAYLYRMTANVCTDVLRRRGRARRFASHAKEVPPAGDGRNVADEASSNEDLQRIERLVARLPRRQAEVVRLRVWDGLRFEEIAEVLGCPAATVKSRFRYALVKLRTPVIQWREERS
jgi:RNA polymerase sigma-70 factor (ECF subfamily)